MSTEQNKSIVRRWIEEGWNKHDLAVIDQVYAPIMSSMNRRLRR